MDEQPNNGWAIASLVFGICGLVFILIPFLGALFAILAVFFSFFGKGNVDSAGSIIGITALVLNAIALLVLAVLVGVVSEKIGTSLTDLKAISEKIKNIDNKTNDMNKQGNTQNQGLNNPAQQGCNGYCASTSTECKGNNYRGNCPQEKPICCTQ